ncbi:MAG: right-handed parallel beta-helix repeat-containing protein [Halanaerobiales bacterium]
MLTKVRSKVFIFLIIISALFLILSGCGSDSSKNTTSVLNSIEITPASIDTTVDETMELTAVGRDQNGEIMTINPSWSISGNVGSISPTEGSSTTFTAATLGEGSITATVGDISGSAEIIVAQQPAVLTELEISPSAASLYDGDTLDLTVTGYDQYDQVISCNPSWSISTELGTFNPENPAAVANTIIDAGGSSSTNGSTIVISGASTDTVTIEGFTITGGIGSSTIGTTSQYGGGIHIHTVKTILRNNIITGNEAHDGGGAIYGYMCDMTLEGNTIENNSSYLAGGGINIGAGSGYTLTVDMTDNIIRNNESEDRNAGGIYTWNVGGIWSGNIIDGNSAGTYAGAIHLNHSSPDIIDNSIINNTADSIAGISIDDNSFPTIQNNIISGNQSASINSRGGGLSIASEGLILSGNEISNNSAVIGAGVYASSVITLDNNNISNNSASSTGGGIYTTKDITLTNNTLDSNTALQGGGIALYAEDKVLTAEGNEFTNNSEYAILLHSNASYEDNGGNTFSGNTPDDILQ